MKGRKRRRVMLLFGVREPPGPPERHVEYEEVMHSDPAWLTDGHVIDALRANGHEVTLAPIFRDARELFAHVDRIQPDVAWNAVEEFQGNRYYESHVAALLELLRLPYTGCGFVAHVLCKDKALTKKILTHHRINVPQFVVSRPNQRIKRLPASILPAFVKPLAGEGSEGIALDSFAETEGKALERVQFLHESRKTDVIVERFIPGREIYVGVLGSGRTRVLPPRELTFKRVPEGEPTYATHAAKWNDEYRERWGIENGFADLPEPTRREVERTARRVYRVLQLRGYGRIDMRLTDDGKLFVMEANPNPDIGRAEDFAQSAAKAGIKYAELVERIVRLAFEPVLP